MSGVPTRVIARTVSSFAAEFGVVDGQPPQVAQGGFELAGEVVTFAAQGSVLAGQFADLAGALVLARARNALPGLSSVVAEFGSDVVVVPPEGAVRQAEAAGQGETVGLRLRWPRRRASRP